MKKAEVLSKPTPFQFICLFLGRVCLWLIAFYFIEQYHAENHIEPLFMQINSELEYAAPSRL
jgi:hypothetical protein